MHILNARHWLHPPKRRGEFFRIGPTCFQLIFRIGPLMFVRRLS
jgi:hypothetical protein